MAACKMAKAIALRIPENWKTDLGIYGVPRGGVPVSYLLLPYLNPLIPKRGVFMTERPEDADIIVDDIIDSGATKQDYEGKYPDKPFFALANHLAAPQVPGQWIVFPWENGKAGDESATDIVTRLLQYIGEDPNRPGVKDTPQRVLKAWKEMTVGYSQKPADILQRRFASEGYDEMISLCNIEFTSICEHHLLPFAGVAHVGYIPGLVEDPTQGKLAVVHEGHGEVVGLSKLARLVDCFAQRLQIQERMTRQIADAIELFLRPRGVGVIVRGKHLCMACRGVMKHDAVMNTNVMYGAFKQNPATRAEFLAMCQMPTNIGF